MRNLNLAYKINGKNHTIKLNFFPEHVCLNYDYIWYDRLYPGHILLRDNRCFHKAKASCYVRKFLVIKQEKCCKSTQNLIFFQCFMSSSKCLPWVIEFQENQLVILIYIVKTSYNNANFISLGKIFDTEDTFARGGWNSIWNLATQAIIQNIQEMPITQTIQSVLYFWTRIYWLLQIDIV